jgi:hypothetical protein
MIHKPTLAALFWFFCAAFVYAESQPLSTPGKTGKTIIAIRDGRWFLDGAVTYPGTRAEGLLMNVRMVNATFEDQRKSEFDPETNTREFIEKMPEYAAQGVRAFTLNLQGGAPGYEGAVNSTFNSDGGLRVESLSRIRRVIEACDRNGCAVILGLFYQQQDQVLKEDDAIRQAIANAIHWIRNEGFQNVVFEIANEFGHGGFDRPILKTPEGEVELIRYARTIAPEFLYSTSGLGDGRIPDVVAETVDFILIHFNGTPMREIPDCIQSLKRYGKPIVCNEDDKTGSEAAQAAQASVENGASWGYMNVKINQYFPFKFNGAEDDPILYNKLKELTSLPRR